MLDTARTVWLPLVFIAACGASQRLPPRIVDDPITLPRGMVELTPRVVTRLRAEDVGLRWDHELLMWGPYDAGTSFPLSLGYGITDRVTLTNLLAVTTEVTDTYAERGSSRLAIAITAGAHWYAIHVTDGLTLSPRLSGQLRKRITPSVRIDANLGVGGDTERWSPQPSYWVHSGADVLVQLTQPLAAIVSGYAATGFGNEAARSTAGGTMGLAFRPATWITLESELDAYVLRGRPSPYAAPATAPGVWANLSARFAW